MYACTCIQMYVSVCVSVPAIQRAHRVAPLRARSTPLHSPLQTSDPLPLSVTPPPPIPEMEGGAAAADPLNSFSLLYCCCWLEIGVKHR